MRVVITAGGTGGHIYPALAIIHKLQKEDKNLEILYIGTTDRMESKIIPDEGLNYIGIEIKGLNRKNIFKNISVINKLNKNVKFLKSKLKEFNPDVVIGVGGYVTFPVLYAAHKCGFKTIIHEQNSIPGLTNKMLGSMVDKVMVSLPGSTNYFDSKKVVLTGNPRSEEVVSAKKSDKSKYELDKNKKTVVIVMGSLGSMTMNNKLKDILPKFSGKDYQVLFVTGNNYYDDYKSIKIENVKIVPYISDMLGVLKFSDLIVSRAGASTIAEITTCKLPSILVPSPYVTNNHQYKNALELEKENACVILKEENFDSEHLIDTIDSILNDKNKYQSMVAGNEKLAVFDSATRVYNEIIKVVKDEK